MGFERRFAIVIGSNCYQEEHDKLQFSLKDADDVRNILHERCEFKKEDILMIKININCSFDIETKINELFEVIKNKGFSNKNKNTFLFYYSGHGIHDSEISYLALSDIQQIEIQLIFQKIKALNAQNSYMIIDACHSGSFIDLNSKGNKEARRLHYNQHQQGIYCLFSSQPTQKSYEPKRLKFIQNGYLTHYLLEVIRKKEKYTDGILGFPTIHEYITIKTQKQTKSKQSPILQTSSTNEIHAFATLPKNNIIEVLNKGNELALFNYYSNDSEPYYIPRAVDTDFINYLAIGNVWLHGMSGSGKTTLINRNLLFHNRKYLFCDLASVTIASVEDILNGIIEIICDGYDLDVKDFSTNKIKCISELLNRCHFEREFIIVIDELSLNTDEIRIAFATQIVNLVSYYKRNYDDSRLRFVVSTIASPNTILVDKGKAMDCFANLLTDYWANDIEKLVDVLIHELSLELLEIDKAFLIAKLGHSPRLMKYALKKILITPNKSKDNICFLILQTLKEAI